jgi:hypothetical protein
LKTDGRQFLKDLAGDKVVTRGFLGMKVADGCLNFRACEAREGQVKLIRGLQEVVEGTVRCGVGTRGMRLKDGGEVVGEGMSFFGIAAGPRTLWEDPSTHFC